MSELHHFEQTGEVLLLTRNFLGRLEPVCDERGLPANVLLDLRGDALPDPEKIERLLRSGAKMELPK